MKVWSPTRSKCAVEYLSARPPGVRLSTHGVTPVSLPPAETQNYRSSQRKYIHNNNQLPLSSFLFLNFLKLIEVVPVSKKPLGYLEQVLQLFTYHV